MWNRVNICRRGQGANWFYDGVHRYLGAPAYVAASTLISTSTSSRPSFASLKANTGRCSGSTQSFQSGTNRS